MTVGVDYLSVGGFKTGGPKTHVALLGAGIWIIEGLNLEHVKPGDYQLVCLPLKLQGSDGAPARAILSRACRKLKSVAWFTREKPAVGPEEGERRVRTEGLWLKCEHCGQIIWRKALGENIQVCPKCEHHFRIDARTRARHAVRRGSI